MYLRDLQICVSRVAVLPDGFSWESVHGPMLAVVEGYLAQLPRRDRSDWAMRGKSASCWGHAPRLEFFRTAILESIRMVSAGFG